VPCGACWLTSSYQDLLQGDASGADGSLVDSESDTAVVDVGVDARLSDGAPRDAASDVPVPIDAPVVDAGCFTDAYVTSVMFDHPVAYYRLDEKVGATTAADSSGHGNAGTYSNVMLGQPGAIKTDPNDTAAGFNGSDSLVTVGQQLSFTMTAPFSVEAWVYPTATDNGYRGVLSAESPNASPRYGYDIFVQSQSSLAGFERWENSSGNQALAMKVSTLAWFHLVGTFDPNRASMPIILYVNGLIAGTGSNAPVNVSQSSTFIIGSLYTGGLAPGPFGGRIDEVAVYDHPIDACVAAHYHLGTGQ
jgi:hypothetical protein